MRQATYDRLRLGVTDLSPPTLDAPVSCFLCGPGPGSKSYDLRMELREHLSGLPGVEVTLGEQLLEGPTRRRVRADLQTVELDHATRRTDVTLLMADGPGAIAELGSFSMVPGLRQRLYVLVADRYFGHASYIARGPLSLIASENRAGVIYYAGHRDNTLLARVGFPVMLHKFTRARSRAYTRARRARDGEAMTEALVDVRVEFLPRFLLAAICVLGQANFAELVDFCGLPPEDANFALGRLFGEGSLEQHRRPYRTSEGLDDPLLDCFDTAALSRKRALMVGLGVGKAC